MRENRIIKKALTVLCFGFVWMWVLRPIDAVGSWSPSLEQDSEAEYESRVLQKKGDTYHIEVRFPEITSSYISFSVKGRVDTAIREYVDRISKTDIQAFIEESPELLVDYDGILENELRIDFKVIKLTPRFISVKFERYFYGAGAAHGMSIAVCFNYDLRNLKELRLSDFFEENRDYLQQISDYAVRDLKRQAQSENKNPEAMYPWIEDGASPTEENLGRFTFDGNSLTVYFDPYQVGSGGWGSREVDVRSAELKGFKANL